MKMQPNSDTPEVDIWEFTDGQASTLEPHVTADFARKLERERDEARQQLEVELGRETCTQCNMQWSPSLIESGWCIFCIQKQTREERDAAKELGQKMCDERDKLRKERDAAIKRGDEYWQKYAKAILEIQQLLAQTTKQNNL